jgi:nucleoside-triphosphatase
MKRLFFITGRPGVGKTTVLLNVANGLRDKGYSVGGMLSREFREEGARVGFELVDFATGQKGWLAHVNQPTGPQVSKYRVNLDDLDRIGVHAVRNALRDAEVVIVDEVGPMELLSADFKQIIKDIADSQKLVLGVIHHSARDSIIDSIKKRSDAEILEATMENGHELHKILIQKAMQFLKERKAQSNKLVGA